MVSALIWRQSWAVRQSSSGCAVVYRYPELPGALAGELIAEPWDIAPGGYQVGNFPRCLPSGTIISAMQPVVSGCI